MESKAFHKGFLLLPIPQETGAAKKARYCMKKRLLSGLLLLAMLLTLLPTMALADDVVDYYIDVNGIDVTSKECGLEQYLGTWSRFDAETGRNKHCFYEW